MNKSITKYILDIVLYIICFIVIQMIVEFAGAAIYASSSNLSMMSVIEGMAKGRFGSLLAITTVISSLFTVLMFRRFKWTPVSGAYLATKPWIAIVWVILLTVGLILPLEWIYERLQIEMSAEYEQLFEGIMKEPWGYFAIGVLAPVAEEFVFRGAVLRTLLNMMDKKLHWVAIAISALLFAGIHGNLAQGLNAFVLGCLLGWMYYRTNSLFPGIVLHLVNNSVAYALYNMFPQMADGKLIDFFHGDDKLMMGGLFFSLCIVIPSLFQLTLRLKKPAGE